MIMYADHVFAPLDADHHLERIAGGNETEVYRTDDRRFVVKLKSDLGGNTHTAVAAARAMRTAAEEFAACLGPEHSITSTYVVARDSSDRVQVLVVQPYLAHARSLHAVDYETLDTNERARVSKQLRNIIRRSLSFYRHTGRMPDLYGRTSTNSAERARLKKPLMLPKRLWSFLVQRNLLRSHNLMLTDAPERRIVLVDYDTVRQNKLYQFVYFAVRWLLFWRDHVLIFLLQQRLSSR